MTISHTIGPFRRCFEIKVQHAFYSDNICRRLKWVPTVGTRQTLDNMGMLLRVIHGGLVVYYDTRRKPAMALSAAQADTGASGLVFKAYAGDPFFQIYTAYPESDNGNLLYLDSTNTAKDKSGAVRLHPKPFVSDREMVSFAKLHSDGVVTRWDLGTPPVLVVCIHPVGHGESPMDSRGNIKYKQYRIHFDKRRTYWKYYVQGPLAAKEVIVVDPERQWVFDQLSADPIVGDCPSVAFISDAPIPLQEVQDRNFQLKLIAGKREKVMIQRLPVAPVDRVHRDTDKFGRAMISEIFIHS